MNLSRRNVLHAALAASLVPSVARAGGGLKTTVVVVNLDGGLHSLYAQADSFVPRGLFNCTGSNSRDVGNGVVVDNATFGTLSPETLARMCNLGIWHGVTAHAISQLALLIDEQAQSYPLQLAKAMGGNAPVVCAQLGQPLAGKHKPIGGLSISKLGDAGAALTILGASIDDEYVPSRAAALAGLKASLRMSTPTLTRNQRSLESLTGGLNGVVRALSADPVAIDWPEISAAYGLRPTETLISGFASQFATAELLVNAGTNVIMLSGGGPGCSLGWDTHADQDGSCARLGMTDLLLPSMRTFLARMMKLPGHNVITAIIGDFTRSADSDHSGMLVASAWGPKLIQGTDSKFTIDAKNYDSYVPVDGQRPGSKQFWSFLAAAAGVQANPFGPNPHPFAPVT